jgi:hypothetical protein
MVKIETIDSSKYQVSLSDGIMYNLQNGDLALVDDAKNAGTYTVVLSDQGQKNIQALDKGKLYDWSFNTGKNASFIIDPAPVVITPNSVSKVAGTTDPSLSAKVSGVIGDDKINYTLSRVQGDTVGDYPINVVAESTQNPNYDVKIQSGAVLHITPAEKTLTGSDYTMYIGSPTPTAKDFKASATNENAQSEDVDVDLSQAKLTTAGTYDVKLSTSDSQEKMVKLKCLEK